MFEKLTVGLGLGLVGILALGISGWVLNIIELLGMSFDVFTLELALRLLGIVVVPLGAIIGWI
jgi:hypothetical protein